MVESNSQETINITSTNVMTGDISKNRQLYYQLISSIQHAKQIDIVVSFLMESGVRMLLDNFKEALDRGASIRILTGNYLGITQPSALSLLKYELEDKVDLRFYDDKNRSFHPKSYIFHYDDYSEIYIGSSNISASALTSGIEWNYRFTSKSNEDEYLEFMDTFNDLFQNHSYIIDDQELRNYAKNWHKPQATTMIEDYDEQSLQENHKEYKPRGAQIEALCALQQSRKEGATKGLVQAAAGVGKTYLAAFDSRDYKRILFVAHREEILQQASISFQNVRKKCKVGFFNGKEKNTTAEVIFASVSTLGNERYLNEEYFKKDAFDYIVVDEFHHAVNQQYLNITNYFKPKFLLGLTATPERMDGRSIYELLDYNIPYEISLYDAINRGMLVPFHYYGIYDETDYSSVRYVRGRYDESQLTKVYLQNLQRFELIYKYYYKYQSQRALGFCCSRQHAEEMAKQFSIRGIPSVAVYSDAHGKYSKDRSEAIQLLKEGKIRVIFSVDMFNEGVDITSIDMVMFLRPTESPIVFLQQLGRGLRIDKGKQFLNVLDFIGNYNNASRVTYYLTGNPNLGHSGHIPSQQQIPDHCSIDLDMRLIDLFKELDKKHQKVKDIIKQEYLRVEELLQHKPTRIELFTYMDDSIYQLVIKNSKDNPFKDYIKYLQQDGKQIDIPDIGKDFIHFIETTNMTKVYKMPVLLAIYNNGNISPNLTQQQLLESWKDFFRQSTNYKDLENKLTYDKYLEITDKKHITKILSMPVHFLLESGSEYFEQTNKYPLCLKPSLKQVINNKEFIEQMKDAIEYRVMDYYKRRYEERK